MTENSQADVEKTPGCGCDERNKEAEASGSPTRFSCSQCSDVGSGIVIGPSTATGYRGFGGGRFYGPQEVLPPWSDIHVGQVNARIVELTTRLERSIKADDFQQIDTLSRAILHLSMVLNGFYGR